MVLRNRDMVCFSNPHRNSGQSFPINFKKRKVNKTVTKMYYCSGGPFDTKKVFLATPTTLVFRVGDYYGYYKCRDNDLASKFMDWVALNDSK